MESIDNKALMKMKNFIGDIKVKNIEELLNSSESGIFVVAGWFVSVVEGVDMWYPRVAKSSSPRYDYLFFLFISLYNYLPQVFLKKSF
jgi:hypothetical protein